MYSRRFSIEYRNCDFHSIDCLTCWSEVVIICYRWFPVKNRWCSNNINSKGIVQLLVCVNGCWFCAVLQLKLHKHYINKYNAAWVDRHFAGGHMDKRHVCGFRNIGWIYTGSQQWISRFFQCFILLTKNKKIDSKWVVVITTIIYIATSQYVGAKKKIYYNKQKCIVTSASEHTVSKRYVSEKAEVDVSNDIFNACPAIAVAYVLVACCTNSWLTVPLLNQNPKLKPVFGTYAYHIAR